MPFLLISYYFLGAWNREGGQPGVSNPKKVEPAPSPTTCSEDTLIGQAKVYTFVPETPGSYIFLSNWLAYRSKMQQREGTITGSEH